MRSRLVKLLSSLLIWLSRARALAPSLVSFTPLAFWLSLALALVPSMVSFGHAVLVESSLSKGALTTRGARRGAMDSQEIPAWKPLSVRLIFNVAVEARLAEVDLLDAGGRSIPLTVQEGSKPNELIVQLPPLPAGDYALDYRILARDGHLTEAALPFKVTRTTTPHQRGERKLQSEEEKQREQHASVSSSPRGKRSFPP